MTKTIAELNASAELHVLDRNDINIVPEMQMRAEVNNETVEQYAENIHEILKEHPLKVAIVEDERGNEAFYLVDGFHRYHASLLADITALEAKVIYCTYAEAVTLAMSANWTNGLRPNNEDAERSIRMLLENAPDFGYEPKAVANWLRSLGIPERTARRYAKDKAEEIRSKREEAVMALHKEGCSFLNIAEKLDITEKAVRGAIDSYKEQDCALSANGRKGVPEECEEAYFFFPEDDEDDEPVVNPADAFNKVLKEHEEERKIGRVKPQDNAVWLSKAEAIRAVGKALASSGIYSKLTKREVIDVLTALIKDME